MYHAMGVWAGLFPSAGSNTADAPRVRRCGHKAFIDACFGIMKSCKIYKSRTMLFYI